MLCILLISKPDKDSMRKGKATLIYEHVCKYSNLSLEPYMKRDSRNHSTRVRNHYSSNQGKGYTVGEGIRL